MRLGERSAAGAVAAGLALALSTAHPNFVSASVTPPAVVGRRPRPCRTKSISGSGAPRSPGAALRCCAFSQHALSFARAACGEASPAPSPCWPRPGGLPVQSGEFSLRPRPFNALPRAFGAGFVRQAMQQKYDDDYQSNFKGAVETKDKKSAYTLVVVGLVAVAFIAPMIQFFYYTGGD
eukprot:3272678-Prymnesium_polylepis.1